MKYIPLTLSILVLLYTFSIIYNIILVANIITAPEASILILVVLFGFLFSILLYMLYIMLDKKNKK